MIQDRGIDLGGNSGQAAPDRNTGPARPRRPTEQHPTAHIRPPTHPTAHISDRHGGGGRRRSGRGGGAPTAQKDHAMSEQPDRDDILPEGYMEEIYKIFDTGPIQTKMSQLENVLDKPEIRFFEGRVPWQVHFHEPDWIIEGYSVSLEAAFADIHAALRRESERIDPSTDVAISIEDGGAPEDDLEAEETEETGESDTSGADDDRAG